MPLLPAKCPECGGLIEVNSEKKAGLCQYCGQPFVVEDAVNKFNSYFNITYNYNTVNNYSDGTIVNVFENDSKDFEIVGGVLKKYHGESTDVVIPDNVVSIGKGCFISLQVRSVTIPESVTCIEDSAFSGCKNLSSLTIPDKITSIGNWAFSHCINLTSVTIGKDIDTIGDFAFSGCTRLSDVKILACVINLGKEIFKDCNQLNTITIPGRLIKWYGPFNSFRNVTFKSLNGARAIGQHCERCAHCGGELHVSTFGKWKCSICGKVKK